MRTALTRMQRWISKIEQERSAFIRNYRLLLFNTNEEISIEIVLISVMEDSFASKCKS